MGLVNGMSGTLTETGAALLGGGVGLVFAAVVFAAVSWLAWKVMDR